MTKNQFLKLCQKSFLLKRTLCKSTKCDIGSAALEKLDREYAKLRNSDTKSLLKKNLTPEIFEVLRTKCTKSYTLLDCIQSGLRNYDSICGVYAPDPEAYNIFAELFDPIIKDYHLGFKKTNKQPFKDFGNPCYFADLDPFKNYIASTRIRCARAIKGYPFNPCMTKEQYDEVEDMILSAFNSLPKEFNGVYRPLFGMERSIKQKLSDDHILFHPNDRYLNAANAFRFWPTGRSIFHNFEKTFIIWCNEEDHLRIISMQRGGNVGEVFSRLMRGLNALESKIKFAHDNRLGYLTFCPTNLGTTIRASVHIRLPKLSVNKQQLEEITKRYKLQIRSTQGEHSEVKDGIYDISNKRRLGLTEFQAVEEFSRGIHEIIRYEKAQKGNVMMCKKKSKCI